MTQQEEARIEKVRYMIEVYKGVCERYPDDELLLQQKSRYESELEDLLKQAGVKNG